MLTVDIECFKDYFLIAFLQPSTGKIKSYEMFAGRPLDCNAVASIMSKNLTVSFNGLNYDLPLIVAALQGFDNQALKNLSNKIIASKNSWAVCRDNHLNVPASWDHIDLIEVAPGRASLKVYGGRLGAESMQDLPYDHDAEITPPMRAELVSYCGNDLRLTALLYDKLLPAIELREKMSKEYGMDLRSKSDAQIAETIIKSEMTRLTGKKYNKPLIVEGKQYRYNDPGVVSFRSEELNDIFARLLEHPFEIGGNGAFIMPGWLKNTKVNLNGKDYRLGIGGLHSCEKGQYLSAGNGLLYDLDVASYYPSIILHQRLAPDSMGADFLALYQSIVTRRLDAKKNGDKTMADALKIAVNGSFGKLGSKYSALYAPRLLLQTTITGQLLLLMLIERMEEAGASVMSANTDGIVCQAPLSAERALDAAAWEWMLDTSFALERTDYRLMASIDVNNYIAVTTDGKAKGKGRFAPAGLMKNPDRSIVYKAVASFLAEGRPIEETIKGATDANEFVIVRRVDGGGVWREALLGKAVRFYKAVGGVPGECIEYARNGNKVPNSLNCRPLIDLGANTPDDVDYQYYIDCAHDVLREAGHNG